ncbi:MAG: hypothetical protein V7752_02110 [Halopseudomonas sp.]
MKKHAEASRSSPLVYLNLASMADGTQLREDPLISSLTLQHQPDDCRLLIALGEVSGSDRPISPKRMTRLSEVLIVWLDEREWLVLPHTRYGHDLEQALENSFGDSLSLDLIPDGTFQAELSDDARKQLKAAQNHPLNGSQEPNIQQLDSVCIRPWTRMIAYDLLLTRADKARLEEWLAPLQY